MSRRMSFMTARTESSVAMVRCPKCKKTKSPNDFYSDKSLPRGITVWCKLCRKRCAARAKSRKLRESKKKCVRCGRERPWNEFPWKQQVKGKYRQRRTLCKTCLKHDKEFKIEQHRKQAALYRNRNIEAFRKRERRDYRKFAAAFKVKRDAIKSEAMRMKGGACERCGLQLSDENPSFCFDFHHPDPSAKLAEPGDLLHKAVRAVDGEARKAAFFEEVMRCDVLCAVCHRKSHYEMGEIVNDRV